MNGAKIDQLLKDSDSVLLAACRAYASMINTMDYSHLEPWLADDLVVISQMVIVDMNGKDTYADYITKKFERMKKEGGRGWAQIAYRGKPCVVLAQETEDNLIGTVFIEMTDEKISEIQMCIIPRPQDCYLSNEYPLSYSVGG